jgi:hypothetical protein
MTINNQTGITFDTSKFMDELTSYFNNDKAMSLLKSGLFIHHKSTLLNKEVILNYEKANDVVAVRLSCTIS